MFSLSARLGIIVFYSFTREQSMFVDVNHPYTSNNHHQGIVQMSHSKGQRKTIHTIMQCLQPSLWLELVACV